MSVLINWLMSLGNFSARRLRWSKLILTTLYLIVLMLNSGHLKLGWTVSVHSQKLIVHKIIVGSLKATCSLDPIPTWLLKQSVDVLTPVITLMLNWSFRKGQVPDCWKSAIVIPRVLKKAGLDYIFNIFRPVSNPPFVAKVVEQAVIGHLLAHGRINAPLPPVNQSSYRTFRLTETALVKVQSAFSWLWTNRSFSSRLIRSESCIRHHRPKNFAKYSWEWLWHSWWCPKVVWVVLISQEITNSP